MRRSEAWGLYLLRHSVRRGPRATPAAPAPQTEAEAPPLKFSQVFHLMPVNNSFVVTNGKDGPPVCCRTEPSAQLCTQSCVATARDMHPEQALPVTVTLALTEAINFNLLCYTHAHARQAMPNLAPSAGWMNALWRP
eukprot:364697-Chlamydomonas_euryale.AAC.8